MSGEQENDNGLRIDGRRPLELRQIRLKMNVFGHADGSAYFEQGKTKVLVAVYGPHQPKSNTGRSSSKTAGGVLNCQYSTAVFSFSAGEHKRRPRGDRKSVERSLQLRHSLEAIVRLELYPRSQIDVFLEILEADGSEFCTAINAATVALIDAGIPIKDYAIGCTVTLMDLKLTEDNKKAPRTGVIDANFAEECASEVTLSFITLPGINSDPYKGMVVMGHGAGQRLHLSKFQTLRNQALCGSKHIKEILDEAVRYHLTLHSPFSPFNLQISLD
ncbi:exosome complex component RRP41 [Orussus abietinus]|uniref:exosome complex component RRP41 n=1 Tax=Orussus abietinus TaxID=222816 RepID=UPI000626E930|nr:exosome complex component RRP41 [Orussus abietinus]